MEACALCTFLCVKAFGYRPRDSRPVTELYEEEETCHSRPVTELSVAL